MQFVWITHPQVEKPARVPVTALPHWTGHGWTRCDPPVKPPRPPRRAKPVRQRAPRPRVKSTPVDAPKTDGRKPPAVKPKQAPDGRKED